MASYYLNDLLQNLGDFQAAAQVCQQALQWCQANDPPSAVACWALTGLGELSYEWNDLPAATNYLQEALELAEHCGEIKVLMYARIALAKTLQAQNQAEQALAVLDKAGQIAEQAKLTGVANWVNAVRAQFWLSQGRGEKAERWLRQHGVSLRNGELSPSQLLALFGLHVTRQSTRKELSELLTRLESQLHAAESPSRPRLRVVYLAKIALIHHQLKEESHALEKLSAALDMAEPMELVRTFVQHGQPMQALLQKLNHHRYAGKLLSHFDRPAGGRTQPRPAPEPASQPLIEPLRQREIEVLEHVAHGRSNREIADEMVVAESTVKWYLRNIYGKLQVNRRTQALARARELHIL
jgi:LuxR family maltose regulon positive regulatory protein